jgi:hypothetical protein
MATSCLPDAGGSDARSAAGAPAADTAVAVPTVTTTSASSNPSTAASRGVLLDSARIDQALTVTGVPSGSCFASMVMASLSMRMQPWVTF